MTKQFETLADAGEFYDGEMSEIWYARDTRNIVALYGERSKKLPASDLGLQNRPWGTVLTTTHTYLGTVQSEDLEQVYMKMQGEMWSPEGEARNLIESRGLNHTSMSVGDLIANSRGLFMVAPFGFIEVEVGK